MAKICGLSMISIAVMKHHDCDQKQLEEEKAYFSLQLRKSGQELR